MKDCPKCNKPLKTVGGLGYVCVTSDCPVVDDADLWVNGKKGNGMKNIIRELEIAQATIGVMNLSLESAEEKIAELKESLTTSIADAKRFEKRCMAVESSLILTGESLVKCLDREDDRGNSKGENK